MLNIFSFPAALQPVFMVTLNRFLDPIIICPASTLVPIFLLFLVLVPFSLIFLFFVFVFSLVFVSSFLTFPFSCIPVLLFMLFLIVLLLKTIVQFLVTIKLSENVNHTSKLLHQLLMKDEKLPTWLIENWKQHYKNKGHIKITVNMCLCKFWETNI